MDRTALTKMLQTRIADESLLRLGSKRRAIGSAQACLVTLLTSKREVT